MENYFALRWYFAEFQAVYSAPIFTWCLEQT